MLLLICFIFGLLGSLTWAGPHARTVCPSGTFALREGSEWNCYKFYEDQLTFEDAEQECQYKWKGHLASFTSEKQAKSLAAYITRDNIESAYVWIGLQRDPRSSMSTGWRWADGSRSRYTKWRTSEPNNLTRDEFCVSLHPSGNLYWVDIACQRLLAFLCKWKPA